MQNNLRNRSVALASTFALALTGIVATDPAASAASAVTLAPTSGTNTGAFTTDQFDMNITLPITLDAPTLAIQIDNPDKESIAIDLSTDTTNDVSFFIRAFTATGVEVSLAADRVSFTGDGAESVDTSRKAFVATGVSARTEIQFDDAEYGDGDYGDITVQTWVEVEPTADYTTIDANASEAATISWYDPKGVAVIPSIERFVEDTGSGSTQLNYNSITTDSDRRGIAGKVRFVQPGLNLEQVDSADWDLEVFKTDQETALTSADLGKRVDLAGTSSTPNDDLAGAIAFNGG